MRVIRAAIGTTTINPELLTCAERLQYEGYLRRQETNAAIMALVRDGVPIKEIVRRTGHSRKLVRQVSRGQSTDIFRTRQSTLDATCRSSTRNGPGAVATAPTLAPPASAGLPRLPTCRQRVDDTAASGGEGDRPTTSESTVGENDRTTDDHGTRSSEQSRYRHHRCHRGTRTHARRRAHLIESFQVMVRNKLVADLDHGSPPPAEASSPPLRVASLKTRPRSVPPSPSPGRTARPKGRSPSSS